MDSMLQLAIAIPLSLLFFSAGRHKLMDREFRTQLAAYELLPMALLAPAGLLLAAIELLTGLLLLVPLLRPAAGFTAAGLLLLYATAMTVNLLRGRHDLDCGCGGDGQVISYWLVLRNVLLAIAASALLLPGSSRSLELSEYLALGLSTAVASLLYLTIKQLLVNQVALKPRGSHES
ncbi:MAG: MauE/DoxX family redox-associated membrane protein [Pseudomonadota bacterium]